MPGVKSELQLQDRMSSVIRDILQGLDSCIDAMEQIERTGSTAFDPKTLNNMRTAANSASEQLNKMSDSERKAGDSAESSEKKHDKLKKTLKAVGAAAATVTAATAAAAFKLGKAVVESYADYEQLVGGVETLFKDSAPEIQKYANEAYKTAGLSANAYMETVTSFSASLIQSLGGDTTKAAKYADMAITDMSDNANKMGTDMSAIQNAYQGFAKQNYTMLDNLKLGYGGTKSEMERLLKDAEKISGIKYDVSSYADIVDAIHVVQTEMGITGTTAEEARKTISGSINMLKGSWQNLLTGLGDPDADVKQLAKNLVKSAGYVIKNVTPVIENIVSVLPMALKTVLRSVERLLPSLLDAGVKLIDSALRMVSKLLPRIAPILTSALMSLLEKVISAAPKFLSAATKVVLSLVNGISSALPDLIPLASEAVLTIALELIRSLPSIIECGQTLLQGLIDGLMAAISSGSLMDTVMSIVDSIVSFLENDYDTLLQTGIDMLIQLIEGLPSAISVICSKLPLIVSSIVSALLGRADVIVRAGVDLLICLVQNAGEIISIVLRIVPQIIVALVNAFRENWGKLKQAGLDLINGLWEGLKQAWSNVTGWIKNIGSGIVKTFKGIFQINSPSRVMRDLGHSIGEGLGGGIGDSARYAVDATKAMSKDVLGATSDMSATAKIGAEFTGVTGSAFTTDGGNYSNYRDAAAAHGSSAPAININVDLSGMQNSIASGNDVEDLVTVLVDGLQRKAATAMQGVV